MGGPHRYIGRIETDSLKGGVTVLRKRSENGSVSPRRSTLSSPLVLQSRKNLFFDSNGNTDGVLLDDINDQIKMLRDINDDLRTKI